MSAFADLKPPPLHTFTGLYNVAVVKRTFEPANFNRTDTVNDFLNDNVLIQNFPLATTITWEKTEDNTYNARFEFTPIGDFDKKSAKDNKWKGQLFVEIKNNKLCKAWYEITSTIQEIVTFNENKINKYNDKYKEDLINRNLQNDGVFDAKRFESRKVENFHVQNQENQDKKNKIAEDYFKRALAATVINDRNCAKLLSEKINNTTFNKVEYKRIEDKEEHSVQQNQTKDPQSGKTQDTKFHIYGAFYENIFSVFAVVDDYVYCYTFFIDNNTITRCMLNKFSSSQNTFTNSEILTNSLLLFVDTHLNEERYRGFVKNIKKAYARPSKAYDFLTIDFKDIDKTNSERYEELSITSRLSEESQKSQQDQLKTAGLSPQSSFSSPSSLSNQGQYSFHNPVLSPQTLGGAMCHNRRSKSLAKSLARGTFKRKTLARKTVARRRTLAKQNILAKRNVPAQRTQTRRRRKRARPTLQRTRYQ